jgi:hypothetical protein
MVVEQHPGTSVPRRSRIISKILPPAVQLWLRSQLDAVEGLQFQIAGGDRQILSGQIPSVTIAAQKVVYQGISISQIRAIGQGIQINLGEVVRGKPLRLMDVVPVQAEARFTEADLNASLQTPLLADALTELLRGWFKAGEGSEGPQRFPNQSVQLHQLQVVLTPNQLVLSGTLVSDQQPFLPFAVACGLQVVEQSKLRFDRPQWLKQVKQPPSQSLTFPDSLELKPIEIDLGAEVNLHQLEIEEGQIICRGCINVLP